MRADSAAWRALDLLPHHLVLSAPAVADALELTRKGAGSALRALTGASILTPYTGPAGAGRGRPPQPYVSEELLGLAGSSPLRR